MPGPGAPRFTPKSSATAPPATPTTSPPPPPAERAAPLPEGSAGEGPGVSAVLEGADGRSLSVFAELTADGGYRVIQWQQSAEWAGEAEAPALFGTLREG